MKIRMGEVIAFCFAMMLCAAAQQSGLNTAASVSAPVPRLIKYSGVAKDVGGKPLSGTVGVTFLLYKDEQGGAPLWLETQSVQADAGGRYSVQLGATQASGLPADLFTSGEARWLGVQISGQAEQPRVLLLSVPYALKAGDAETVGGLPASAFVLATPSSANPTTGVTPTASTPPPVGTTPVTTAGGTVNTVAKFDANADITNSQIVDTGTNVGIGTTTPTSKLDVKGGATIRGTLLLPAAAAATAAVGGKSQPENMVASSYNSGTATSVNQTFQLRAEPAGNDTATPSATLNLLFGSGTTAPAETGLHIASNGQIAFATGQTFPGTGTITGITTGPGGGLTGGGTSGNLSLGLTNSCTTGQALLWNGSAWACATPGTGTITGVTAGTDLTGGGTTGNVTLNLDSTKVPQLATANTFTGNQTVNGNITATGTMSAAAATITGSNAGALLNVTQSGSGPGIVLSSASGSPALKVGSSGTTALQATTSASPGFGILGMAAATTGSATGVAGDSGSNAGSGVVGDAYSTTGNTAGVVGIVASPSGVAGVFNNSAGGSILLGSNNGVQKFLVDGSGNVTATGTGSFNALAVNSTAQVANLNASLLGGLAASAFQPAGSYLTNGSNTFNGTQYIGGSGTSATLQMDNNGVNAGGLLPGIRFGSGGSGEGLSSQRTGTGNVNGLDLYTNFTSRISIANNGNIGIGINPTTQVYALTIINNSSSDTYAEYAGGFSAPSGSGLDGSHGIASFGGNGDQNSGTAGGTGVFGVGGNSGPGGRDGIGGDFAGGDSSVDGDAIQGYPGSGYAGNFFGNVNISGAIFAGTKDFKIDHPLDPANKYLLHASIESDEMVNVYSGNVVLDTSGHADVPLPDWFEAVNSDFRYQLTAIGRPSPGLYVAQEVSAGHFEIAGGNPGVKVSWQITGVRHDAFATAHPLVVEEEKSERLRGYYIHPELYGAPEEKQVEWARHPDIMRRLKDTRAKRPATPLTASAQTPTPVR